MTADTPNITETADAFIANDIVVTKLKKGQSNSYNPAIIKAIGVDLFLDLVAPKEPFPIPDLGFTDAEWDDMENQLHNAH